MTTDYMVTGHYRVWPVLDRIPEGWREDKHAGSPLHGYVFVTNGKSILSGEQIRALAPVSRDRIGFAQPVYAAPVQHIEPEKPKQQIDAEYRRVLNDLARKKVQEQLLRDIQFDMIVCKLEGWDHMEYLCELKRLIMRLSNGGEE